MIVDLNALPPDLLARLDVFTRQLRRPFQEFVDSICAQNLDSPDWWVSDVAYRHPHILFYRISRILFARQLLKEGRASAILSGNVVDQALIDNTPVARTGFRTRLFLFRRRVLDFARCAAEAARRIHWARRTRGQVRVPEERVILLGTYVTESYVDQPDGQDRYFPGLRAGLAHPEQIHVVFQTFQDENYRTFFTKLRTSSTNYILREDYLTFGDYAYALLYGFRILRLLPAKAELSGVDFRPLIRDVLVSGRFGSQPVDSLLTQRLMLRLKQRGWKVRLLVDWFENQWMNKGLHLGFNQAFPDSDSVGYQGFPQYDLFLNLFPTVLEKNAHVLPRRLAVVGSALLQPVQQYCSDLPVTLAPAYRFSHVFERRRTAHAKFTILAAVPYFRHMAEGFIQQILASAAKGNVEIQFKPHPTEEAYVRSTFAEIIAKAGAAIVTGPFGDCLTGADVFVSTASSTCLESMACGVPCVIVASQTEPTSLPFPEPAFEEMWRVAYTDQDIASSVDSFRLREAGEPGFFEATGRRLRAAYFQEVTPGAAQAFLVPNSKENL